MTIVRVGTNQKYSDGWETAFGGKRSAKATAGKASKKASAKRPAKKAKKK